MSREIKFRAWDHKNKKMMPVAIFGIEEWFVTSFTRDWIHNSMDWDSEEGCPNNFEVMQFTGLRDKNGKEIFEGDVVKLHDKWDSETSDYTTYEVCIGMPMRLMFKVLNQSLHHEFIHKLEKGEFQSLGDWTFKHFAVIGNIHDNTELL